MRQRIRYCGDKAFDDRVDTVWAEGVPGSGIGESITVKLERRISLDEIEIMPGFFDAKYFKANNRIKRFSLETGDGQWKETFQCRDSMNPQRFRLSKRVSSDEIVFSILDVFRGDQWDDSCLSELAFLTQGIRIELLCSRIEVRHGAYSLSFGKDDFGLYPLGEGGYPVAGFTVRKDGSLGGDLGPGSQVGMPILEGGWRFSPDCMITLTYTYGVGRKMMGEDEEEEDLSPYSSEESGGMVILILGEKPKNRTEEFDEAAGFACTVIP